MNKYTICTMYGMFVVEAAELTAEVEAERKISYVLAFDCDGEAIAYFENVYWYMKQGEHNGKVERIS